VGQGKPFRRYLPLAAGGLIVAVVLVGLIWVIVTVLAKKSNSPKRQTLQIVKIIRPPPLPPPPPPPPPPDKVEQPLPKDRPDEKPDQTPPDKPLGLDADASAGSDGFGLAARKGGQDLIGGKEGAFAWYTGILKSSVLDALSDDERIRRGNYSVIIRIWLTADGRVERIALAQPSGNRDVDGYIQQALTHLTRIREAPPIEMPQPVTLKIVSRG
jgi:periplasmic protein TonB